MTQKKRSLLSSLLSSVLFHGAVLATLGTLLSLKQIERARIPLGVTLEFEETTAPQAPLKRKSPRKKHEVHEHDAYDLIASDSHSVAEKHEAPEPPAHSEGPIGVSDGQLVSARERYLFELRTFIEQHKRYPAAARMMGQAGRVEISFTLFPDGAISDVKVRNPCPHDHLNEAAVDLVAGLKRFQPIPEELRQQAPWQISLPIEYQLN